jgi:predicted nucleotidyltransferase component of viral defense system
MSGPTAFQIEVARLFFSLPASKGFLIAGGGALLATGLTSRPTQDLDFFGEMGQVNISEAREQFLRAATNRHWKCKVIQSDELFVRMHVKGTEEVLVDIAIDVAARFPSQISVLGPTFNHEELAGRKMLALFDRAEARDFADVFALAKHFSKELLLLRASELEVSLETEVLAAMMRSLSRFSDDELPIDQSSTDELRNFFAVWANELGSAIQ